MREGGAPRFAVTIPIPISPFPHENRLRRHAGLCRPQSSRRARANEVIAVYTQPDRPAGRGRGLTPSPVKLEAIQRGIPVLQPETLKSQGIAGRVARDGARSAGGRRLRPDPAARGTGDSRASAAGTCMLRCCRAGAARRRSSARSRRAIRETGVCLMQMEAGLDTGPVLLRRRSPIGARRNRRPAA